MPFSHCSLFSVFALVTLLVSGVNGFTAPANQPVQFQIGSTGSCLTALSNSNGAAVTINQCSETSSQHSWTVVKGGSSTGTGAAGPIEIYSGKCLDVPSGGNFNGNKLQIWACSSGNKNQQWNVNSDGTIRWSGMNKCLDLTGGDSDDGNRIWTCSGGNANQKWVAASVSSGGSGGGGGGGGGDGGVNHGFWKSNSKLGAAYPDGNGPGLQSLRGIRMMYTWTARCPSGAAGLGIACLPQLWSWKNLGDFQQVAKTANPPLFLTFNEPQERGQADMSVSSGIKLWRQAIKPLRDRGHAVGSPATSSNPNGLVWVKQFKEECGEDCDWDITCIHWYDTTFEKFKNYVIAWHNAFGKPILITEFAAQNFNRGGQPTKDEVWAFYEQAIPWLNSQPYVYGYFPFGMMIPPTGINPNDNLMNRDGSLTDLGHWIVNQGT